MQTLRVGGLALIALGLLALLAQAGEELTLPEGPGRELVQTTCNGCHNLDLVRQQHLDRAAWERNLNLMVENGAGIEPQDREVILTYLVAHFGPASSGLGATMRP
ncbi:hypothetical protein [Gloeobacter kilaueensis]|uniref:Quinohemoprotein amine dehydrogenase alpha subunit haem binding domain-containing protein n=1 Tax=Gloeobacter kilaueensis (strain ATCC BAA-2537 / CCAP 1431/1 / ULC 316 / JS1) TaxID=1183438 RepID=U5QN45_GLOK1|nr:hypothetical protein [Gloeobacter kilaueensis]AGY60402.1 hypothetical protein GKIL_4156 [Gloeobacter kilaueensis JS1]